MIELINITSEAMRNYYYLWYAFNENRENFTLLCNFQNNVDCTDPLQFILVYTERQENLAMAARRNPKLGMLVEGVVSGPPCKDPQNVEKFKINLICKFLQNISVSENNEAFLNLMKFTKQSPVSSGEDDEHMSVFFPIKDSLHGYSLKGNKVKHYFGVVVV